MIYIFGAIAMFILVFGSEGRGFWSKNISYAGGLLWLGSIVWAFYTLGWKNGSFYLIGTLVVGAIFTNILRPLLNPHGH
jgi:hypothetical protein